MDQPEPTPQMIEFFEQRTRAHIGRVARNLALLAEVFEHHGEVLRRRGRTHDASKFGPAERIPYIWLTEYHRCRRNDLPFEYPEGIEDDVKAAVRHHLTSNRHHAEFHSTPDDMTDVDLMEMVCDWTAMAQEYEENGGSAKAWADKTIGTRVEFSADKTRFVYETIATLDQLNAAQTE